MKKFIYYFMQLAIVLSVFTACKDDDNVIPDGDAEITAFGFYAEDNQGVLLKDYVAENIGAEIIVNLPENVEKTALVARFEVSEKDVVTVGDVTQESGVTTNDYTNPVDMIVTEGKNNTMYTVKVKDLPSAVWTKVMADETDLYEFTMKVNPTTNVPYFAYVIDADETADRKVGVFKLDNDQLVSVGSQTTFSEGRARYISLAFSNEGVPFVSYADYTNTAIDDATRNKERISCMYLNGSNWELVGGASGKGITDVRIEVNDITVKADGNPILFCKNNDAGALAKKELNISEFDGSTWTTSVSMPGRASTQYVYYPKLRVVNGVIYAGMYNFDAISRIGTFSVYKRENDTWATVVDQYLEDGATTGNLRDFDMDVDNSGNIYVAYADDEAGVGIYYPKVKKYDASTQKWSTIASAITLNLNDIREFSLAVSPIGEPVLMYRDESKFPNVVSLDKKSQQWTTPVILDQIESENLRVDFTSDGIAYAACTNGATGGTLIYKYDIPQSE